MQSTHKKLSQRVITLLLTVTSANVAANEIPPLVTDRPDQTESAVTVPKGFAQFEVGWAHTYIKYREKIFTPPRNCKIRIRVR